MQRLLLQTLLITTGLFFTASANSQIGLHIKSTGNVGIGTPTPDYKLDVPSDATSEIVAHIGQAFIQNRGGLNFHILNDNLTGDNVGFGQNTGGLTTIGSYNHDIVFYTDSAATVEAMRIYNNGEVYVNKNFGLGTNDPGLQLSIGTPGTGIQNDGSNNLLIYNSSSENARFTSTGRLGLGTTNPQTALHVSAIGTGFGWTPFSQTVAILERTGGSLLTLVSSNTGVSSVVMGDTDDQFRGRVRYEHADDRMELWTANVERVSILNNGNVGIGFDSPEDRLHVQGSIRMVDGNQAAGRIPVSDANGKMTWTDPGNMATDTLNIIADDDRNTFIDVEQSPDEDVIRMALDGVESLTISKSDPGSTLLAVNGTLRVNDGTQADGFVLTSDAAGNASWQPAKNLADSDNDTKIQVEESSDEDLIRFDVAGTEVLRFGKNTNGNTTVAIPGNSFFIGNNTGSTSTGTNNICVGGASGHNITSGHSNTLFGTGTGQGITTGDYNTFVGINAGSAVITTGTGNTIIGANAGVGFPMSPLTNNNTFIGTDAGNGASGSGNVFIGTSAGAGSSSSDRLYIDNTNTSEPLIFGNFEVRRIRIYGDGQGSDYYPFVVHNERNPLADRANGIEIRAGQNDNTDNSRFVACITPDGDEIGSIRQNGNSTVNFDENSDRRLKTNIQPTAFSIEDVMNIQVRDYSFKSEMDVTRTGFIAQELYEIFPHAVSVGGEDVKADPWGVDYGKLTPLLVKAIQDQQQQIEYLQSIVASLQSTVASLQSAVLKEAAGN